MAEEVKYTLGDDIEIYCRWCRLNTNGVVSALDQAGALAKVQCRTCRNFLPFKPPRDAGAEKQKLMDKALRMRDRRTSSGSGKSTKQAQDTSLSAEAVARRMWDEATREVNPLKSKIYRPTLTLEMEDIVTHPKHGLGVVSEVGDDYVLALFREGIQRLDHNQEVDG
ncbi:MAG: hypothetical protein ISR64_08445 [Deltaproteobacteria bacterium]|nr:hypothetical protein [Deltaproteobacteria bacterium]